MKYGMPYKGSKNKLAGQIFELFPLFYATEGAYCDRCQLTNEEAEKINIWKEKLENCPLKKVETFEDWLSPEIHAEIMNGYSSAEDKMKLAKKIYDLTSRMKMDGLQMMLLLMITENIL